MTERNTEHITAVFPLSSGRTVTVIVPKNTTEEDWTLIDEFFSLAIKAAKRRLELTTRIDKED